MNRVSMNPKPRPADSMERRCLRGRSLRLLGAWTICGLLASTSAWAQTTRTYRCENDSSVTYQAVPCDGLRNAQASAAAAQFAANDGGGREAAAQARRERELAERMAAERRMREAAPAGGATHFNSGPMRAGPPESSSAGASAGKRARGDKPFVAVEPRPAKAADKPRAALKGAKSASDKPDAADKPAKKRKQAAHKTRRASDGDAGGSSKRARLNAP
jgi:hypothetical protein